MKKFILAILLPCFCFGALFSNVNEFHVEAQQTCTDQNSPKVMSAGFPRGKEVQVYIATSPAFEPGFNKDQADAIKLAFNNWQNANGANNSGVTFKFVDSIPPDGTYKWIVGYSTPTVTVGSRGESGVPVRDAAGNAQEAQTAIDPRVTAPAAITDVMAHEIGHPMGLDDCNDTCSATDSVMSKGNPRADYWNGLSGRPTSPTNCDNQNLKTTNYPILLLQDGGGNPPSDPGYPSCTPYYWLYYQSWDGGETWELVDVSYAGCW